jgi:LmeA-like phospholipid-binding
MRRLVIAVGILAVLLVVADRVGAVVAARAVAKQVQNASDTSDQPEVDVNGFPFLTQAFGGKYRDIRVKIEDLTAGPLHRVKVDARLRGVHAPLSEVANGHLDSVPVDDVDGTVAVPYGELARASGVPGLTIQPGDGGLKLSGHFSVLGQSINASAVAKVTIGDNGVLVVTASDPQVTGVDAPAGLITALIEQLSFRVDPRRLPLGLRITGVDAGTGALTVHASGHNVVLTRDAVDVIR